MIPTKRNASTCPHPTPGSGRETLQFTLHRVADRVGEVWIALKGGVYDVSAFHRIHPGGSQIILDHAGTVAWPEAGEPMQGGRSRKLETM